MANEAARVAASILAIPAQVLTRGVQGIASGPRVLLDLEVRRWEDAMLRQGMIHRLRRAAADPSVVGVLLRLEAPPGSWAACQDLRGAIQRLRKAGKPVYAFFEQPTNALVWIASACDRVFVVPTGELLLVGVGAELTFFGELFERLGVEPDFEAAGAYKSFGEPYTRKFASPANQEAMRALVDDLQDQLVVGLAEGRGLPVDTVRAIVARAPISAAEALEAKLVDQLAYEDEVETWLEQHHGDKVKKVEFAAWARRDAAVEWADRAGEGGPAVAVLHLDGPIVTDERGPALMVRARKVVPILRRLRENERVKAVVLHVNSPGGSAIASDLIWREVDELQRKKPVIACFEDVAASGGFYLAAPAAEIISRPATLTGSIGVFGGKLVVGEGLRKLGVHTQEFAAAPNATVFSATKHFTPDQRKRFKASLQRFYDGFVTRVAAGRRKPLDVVEPHCRGRVWTGRAARDVGLVDRHGDLIDAIDRARSLAGLDLGGFARLDFSSQPSRSILARAIHGAVRSVIPGGAQARWIGVLEAVLGPIVGRLAPSLKVVIEHPEQPLAMLPFDIDLK